MKLYKIGPVTLGFENFPEFKDWPFRDWKLDAYRVIDGKPDIKISYLPCVVVPQGTLIDEQRSLNAKRQLWREDEYLLWQQTQNDGGMLQYKITTTDITLLADTTNTFGLAALEVMTFFIFDCFLHKDILTFHSCLVEHNGSALMFAGPSGVGKSTQARMWRQHKNALILNSDRGCCYMQQGQWIAFGTPWCGTGGENINRQVPVRALVILQPSTHNRVVQLEGQEMLSAIMAQLCPVWDVVNTKKIITLLNNFLENIPVLRLECTPDVQAVETLNDYLENMKC